MDYLDSILIQAISNEGLISMVLTRHNKQVQKLKDDLWAKISKGKVEQPYYFRQCNKNTYTLSLDNYSYIRLTSLEHLKLDTCGVRADIIYFFKNDNLSPDEKIHLLTPLLAYSHRDK